MKKAQFNLLRNKTIQLVARYAIGGVFIYASLDKIAFPRDFANIVVNYHILPNTVALYFGFILPWIELIFGIFLILEFYVREIAFLFLLLLLVFIAAIIIKYTNGTLSNCGCFSTSQEAYKQNIFLLIGRNLLLIAACTLLFINKAITSSVNNK